jgi:hypothetical protein
VAPILARFCGAANPGCSRLSGGFFAQRIVFRSRKRHRLRSLMLRTIITDKPREQKWTLQGRLCGKWAADLKEKWEETRSSRVGRDCVVDLEDVMAVDQTGKSTLLEMAVEGAHLIARRAYMKFILEEISSTR